MYIPIIFFLSDVTLRVEDEDEEIDEQDELLKENNRKKKSNNNKLFKKTMLALESLANKASAVSSTDDLIKIVIGVIKEVSK